MKLYTKTVCPKCLYVKSELAQAGIEVELVNLDHNQEAMQKVTEAGFSSVPILQIDDELIGNVPDILERIGQLVK